MIFSRWAAMMAIAVSIMACNIFDSRINQFHTLSENQWIAGEPVLFLNMPFDSVMTSSDSLTIYLRHLNNYPYRNLWLFIDYISNDNSVYTDTVEFELADIYGKWQSKGFGTLYEFSAPIAPSKTNIRNVKSISVWHGMRCDTLAGVSELGISLKH